MDTKVVALERWWCGRGQRNGGDAWPAKVSARHAGLKYSLAARARRGMELGGGGKRKRGVRGQAG